MIKLESKSKEVLLVDKRFSDMSRLVRDMLESNDNLDEIIPLEKFTSDQLRQVIEYCKSCDFKDQNYVKTPVILGPNGDAQDVFYSDWEPEFFSKLSLSELIALVDIANFLDIPKLVDGCCA